MAFPTVAGSSNGATTVNATSSTVNLPASLAAGDLLIVVFTCDQNTGSACTWPTGYTEIYAQDSGIVVRQEARYRVWTGSEDAAQGSDGDIAIGHESNMASWVCLRITGFDSGTAPQGTSTSGSGNPSPDPPTFDPPVGGTEDWLWLAVGGNDDGTTIFTGDAPTNYTHVDKGRGANAQSTGTCVARRNLNASSEDPGAFTLDGNEGWIAATIAIRPTAAGGEISGALSVTLGALGRSAAGTVDVAGALARTLGALTLSASEAAGTSGQLAKTLGALTVASAGAVAVAGAAARTLSPVTTAAAGAVAIAGALAKALGALTLFSSPVTSPPLRLRGEFRAAVLTAEYAAPSLRAAYAAATLTADFIGGDDAT